jgi:hypothetical protein
VDAHVHVYDCFDLTRFFDSAHENFASEARSVDAANGFVGVLLLCEADGCDFFRRFAHAAGGSDAEALVPGWRFERTWEPDSLIARSTGGRELIVIAGHQVVTRERLEVLALCCAPRPESGLSLPETLRRTAELGGVGVIAWGAGKWLGRRGAVLRRFLAETPASGVFLGDNGGRLRGWPAPRPLREAPRRRIGVLPGSDPLPRPSHQARAGSYGFLDRAEISMEWPARSLRRRLAEPGFAPRCYGSLARPSAFALDQAAMQVRNRLRRR